MTDLPPVVIAFRELFVAGFGSIDDHLLAPDVILRPPTYGKEWSGQALVSRLLTFAADALGGLVYTDFWSAGDRHVLRFEGAIDGIPMSGVDIVEVADGRITCIEIFARPPKAVLALRDAMGTRVAGDPAMTRAMGLS